MSKETVSNLGQAETTLGAYRDRDEQLRELLSYCQSELNDAHGGAWDAYSDVAKKLTTILDGEQ